MSELLPTQDADELHHISVDGTQHCKCWGRLLPLRTKLPAVDLIEECYTFGRADSCTFVFIASMFDDQAHFSTFSKEHFRIMLESTNQGTIPFIQDLSSNGTFINGIKIGRGKKCPLNNNDEVALSVKHFKCFIFSDSNSINDQYPPEVTEKYTVSRLLGRGACGEVRLVFERHSCQKCAMKIVQKKTFSISSKMGEAFIKRIQSEVDILMKLTHPCIIYINDVIDTEEALYMILELVEGGELFDRIIRLGHLPEADSKFLFLQMVYAVKYLHENGITHRDLKPENILLSGSENRCLIKVTDFGLSKLVDGNTMLRTFCGTPTYLAPEVLKTAGSGTYTPAIDIWSLGVILYVCLVGYPPFTDERQDYDLQTQIVNGLYEFPEAYWGEISNDAKHLITGMLTVEPSERLTIQSVLDHQWLNDPAVRSEVDALIALENSHRPMLISTSPAHLAYSELSNGSRQDAITPVPELDATNHASNVEELVHLSDKPIVRKRPSQLPLSVIPAKQHVP